MSDPRPYRDRWRDLPVLTSAHEYDGQRSVIVAATQQAGITATAAARLVSEWVEFFASGPSPIRELDFVTRTPRRLFDALATQTQLERLQLKWGDYETLEVLGGMHRLSELVLGGAASVRSLAPLAGLTTVRRLRVEGLRHVSDLSPIGDMVGVVDLEVGGDWMSPRIVHVDSIAFLDRMPQLRELLMHTIIVDDRDYSPLLRLPSIERVRVMKSRGMRPPIDELIAALPWSV